MKSFKNKNIVIISLIVIIVTLIATCIVLALNNNEKVDIYTISGESENFYYNDAMFVSSEVKNIYVYGNIIIKNPEIKEEDITNYELNSGKRLIVASSSPLKGFSVENFGYDELFPKEVVEDLDNWYLEITYKVDDETKTEKIELENRYIMDKVKTQPIA